MTGTVAFLVLLELLSATVVYGGIGVDTTTATTYSSTDTSTYSSTDTSTYSSTDTSTYSSTDTSTYSSTDTSTYSSTDTSTAKPAPPTTTPQITRPPITLTPAVLGLAPDDPLRTCCVDRFGKVTAFSGETANVEVPCGYILADITCGDYHVVVDAESQPDCEFPFRFSPSKVRVQVRQLSTGATYTTTTCVDMIQEANSGAITPEEVWMPVSGSMDNISCSYQADEATLEVKGAWKVTLCTVNGSNSVTVKCMDPGFNLDCVSTYPYPLCGLRRGSLRTRKMDLQLNALPVEYELNQAAVTYDVFGNYNYTQEREECACLKRDFTTCGGAGDNSCKSNATAICSRVFGFRHIAKCLVEGGVDPVGYFSACMKTHCELPLMPCDQLNSTLSGLSCECKTMLMSEGFGLDCASPMKIPLLSPALLG